MSIRLYIGNLPKEVDRKDLQAVFADVGESVSTKVITDRKTGKCRGFGFLTVKNDEQADEIIEKYNGYVFQDSALKIEKALPRNKSKSGGDEEPRSSSKPSTGARRSSGGGKGRRSSGGGSDSDAVQPDPRWAGELEKLKQMLATQTTNS
ncbi:RNA recognition motif domain-containing protein [Oxynema aestuarii]|jgi:RNA recognition motif-containing protein|uniref:RNA-binding protein n=1 Tax=Oxynema aestuarii AP17 TaxID=2064643 RepID=A0A6H1TZU8_9CYAN|nr:RNA-binding protein [Oxynema aestuarii]QIZ70879.1 RNA-binding protein [Oxynema aestuarii AP17]RMH72036.1 MAG: RNA-binding protein [Cyanobacteria bacterium J007]